MKVEEVMTRDVITVGPDTPLRDVAATLTLQRISGVPVVARAGEVVGIVSQGDILFKERGPSDRLFARHRPKLRARTAGEAMTSPAKTIAPWRPVSAAATIMLEEGVNRLPVVLDGRLLGIVTRSDLVRAFARPDDEIAREIRENVLRDALWIAPPERVSVEVSAGKVTLAGCVDSRADAELVATHAGKVPGVVEVESSIGWLDDDGRFG